MVEKTCMWPNKKYPLAVCRNNLDIFSGIPFIETEWLLRKKSFQIKQSHFYAQTDMVHREDIYVNVQMASRHCSTGVRLYCIVLYCVVSYRTVPYHTVPYHTVSYRIVSHCLLDNTGRLSLITVDIVWMCPHSNLVLNCNPRYWRWG